MIDTLKLTRRLERAGMPRAQAEELPDGLAEGLREPFTQRLDLIDSRLDGVESRLDGLEHSLAVLIADVSTLKTSARKSGTDVAELETTTKVQAALLGILTVVALGLFWQMFTFQDKFAQLNARLAAIEVRLPPR